MDGQAKPSGAAAGQVRNMRRQMPRTAQRVDQARADHGAEAVNALIQRGLAGEPNCFWAVEHNPADGQTHFVGTPFNAAGVDGTGKAYRSSVAQLVADCMVAFGPVNFTAFGPLPPKRGAREGADGAH